MKKILIKLRTFTKLSILIFISIILILGVVSLIYKPIYAVYLDGELVGYSEDKGKLQSRITDYIENGDEDLETDNLAFVSIEELPTYSMCLLKRNVETNDDEIFSMIKTSGIPYYKYYAILDDDDEKVYVSDFETAKDIVQELKDKNSNNIDDITIEEKYKTKLEDFTDKDDAVDKLYEKKVVVVAKTSSSSVSTARNMSYSKVSLGISLIKPISGTISSRFGSMSSVRSGAHTGLDIAAAYGTKIKAAAGGTVVFSGWNGAYGKMIAIKHSNGVLTYYGHCSSLYVSVGDTVSQGETIAAVGSTGNSTGPHLHLEIRIDGIAYNPQNYLY